MLDLEGKKNEESQAAREKLQAPGRLEKANNLERTSRILKEANEKMKETVEKLKNLDLQMEEKRKIDQIILLTYFPGLLRSDRKFSPQTKDPTEHKFLVSTLRKRTETGRTGPSGKPARVPG